jgi:hypothetical protein
MTRGCTTTQLIGRATTTIVSIYFVVFSPPVFSAGLSIFVFLILGRESRQRESSSRVFFFFFFCFSVLCWSSF